MKLEQQRIENQNQLRIQAEALANQAETSEILKQNDISSVNSELNKEQTSLGAS